MSLDVDAAAAFRVVGATEAGDIHHAALVDVHHTGCEGRERGDMVQSGSGWPRVAQARGFRHRLYLGQLIPSCSPTSEPVAPSREQTTLPNIKSKGLSPNLSHNPDG